MCVCVWICAHKYRNPWSSENGTGSPRPGVTGDCKHPLWLLGTELRSSEKNRKCTYSLSFFAPFSFRLLVIYTTSEVQQVYRCFEF